MSDTGEKKRRKPKPESEPSPDENIPPRRSGKERREGKEGEKVNGKSEKRSKRANQEQDEAVDERLNEADEVVIDMSGDAPPRARKPKKPKKKNPEREELEVVAMEESSSEEGRKQKPKPKPKSLAQSRRWDQEDLEVIVPVEEVSEESEDEGANLGGHTQTLEILDVLAMPDSEKEELDWLTRVMPDEVLRKIYSHMEPVDVDRTATVCRRTNDMIQERSIWKVYLPDWSYVSKDKFNKAHTRSGFAACYNHEMQERRATKARIEAAEYAEYLQNQSEWAKGWMTMFLFNRSIDYFSVLCFILGTCFAAARSQEAILWNWRLVLLPFYVPMLQLMLTPLVYDLCRRRYTSANIDEVTDSSIVLWHISFVENRPYRPLIYLTNFAMLIFWIMLMVKLNDNLDGMPAGPLIIPWLLLLIALILEQMFGWASGSSWEDGRWVDRFFIIVASIIGALVMLLIVLKLDRVISWNWVLVLIPLWVLFGFAVIYPALMLFCAECSYSFRSNIRIVDAEGVGTGVGFHIFCVGLVFAPIFTWVLLTALNLDGTSHRSWPVIFIPIFIIEGLMLIGCGLVDFISWCDN
jgi:hypothetical protein